MLPFPFSSALRKTYFSIYKAFCLVVKFIVSKCCLWCSQFHYPIDLYKTIATQTVGWTFFFSEAKGKKDCKKKVCSIFFLSCSFLGEHWMECIILSSLFIITIISWCRLDWQTEPKVIIALKIAYSAQLKHFHAIEMHICKNNNRFIQLLSH